MTLIQVGGSPVIVHPSGQADIIEVYNFSFAGTLIPYTGQGRLYLDVPMQLQSARFTLGIAADRDTIFALRCNGTSIMSTNALIPTGAFTVQRTTGFSKQSFVGGDYLTVDVIQAGIANPGEDLTVTIRMKRLV